VEGKRFVYSRSVRMAGYAINRDEIMTAIRLRHGFRFVEYNVMWLRYK
jgi:hypothetical protein